MVTPRGTVRRCLSSWSTSSTPPPMTLFDKRAANRAFTNFMMECEDKEKADIGECAVGTMTWDYHRKALRNSTLAESLIRSGRESEAEKPASDALRYTRSLAGGLGDTNAGLATKALSALVNSYAAQAKYTDAVPYARELMERNTALLGVKHPATILPMMLLASLLGAIGRFRDAGELLKRAVESCEDVYGIDHPATKRAATRLRQAESGTNEVDRWTGHVWLDRFFLHPKAQTLSELR